MGLLLLSLLKKIIKILANNSKPKQIAISICFGMLIGLVPFNTLFYLFLFLAICILPTNIVAISLGMIIYNPFSYLIYPLADSLGYYLLVDAKFLQAFWTYLYNLPIIPWLKFNHTLQLGCMIIGFLLIFPVYKLSLSSIRYSKTHLASKFSNLPFLSSLSASPVIKWVLAIKKWIT